MDRAALQLFHYRDKQQRDVHIVIERHDGDVIGIEATFARDRCRVPGAIDRLATLPLTPHGNPELPGDRDDRPLRDHPRAGNA